MLTDVTPHSLTCYGPPTVTRDAGGGEVVAWPTARGVIGGLLATLSGDEQELFAQAGLVVTHRFGTKDTTAARGDKMTLGSRSFHIKAIQTGEAWGSFPVLRYVLLQEIL